MRAKILPWQFWVIIIQICPYLITYPIEGCFLNLRIPTAVLAGVCGLLLLLLLLDIS